MNKSINKNVVKRSKISDYELKSLLLRPGKEATMYTQGYSMKTIIKDGKQHQVYTYDNHI